MVVVPNAFAIGVAAIVHALATPQAGQGTTVRFTFGTRATFEDAAVTISVAGLVSVSATVKATGASDVSSSIVCGRIAVIVGAAFVSGTLITKVCCELSWPSLACTVIVVVPAALVTSGMFSVRTLGPPVTMIDASVTSC